MADQGPSKRVNAAPEKRFFISMLVKDIELIPAILDLVDNSVDGAKRLRPEDSANGKESKPRFHDLFVRLTVGSERFRIEDNCGGIPVTMAREYAFRFGRPEDVHGSVGEVGQFGVGMKRALFKLGSEFWVESVAADSRFVLPVGVEEWAKEAPRGLHRSEHDTPDWSFELDEVEEGLDVAEEDRGTTIEVTRLHPSVRADLATDLAQSRLRANMELRHQVALAEGLEISLNDEPLRPLTPQLLFAEDFVPLHVERAISVDGSVVDMSLFAGVERVDDGEPDTDDAEQFRTQGRAGWYMFCNDRLLFAADKSPLTGWGSAGAAYHPQYRQFRGYVFLESDDSSALPWNTTKTGVDEDAEVFRIVQGEMFSALRAVQATLNRAKTERQERAPDERPVLAAMNEANPTALGELPSSDRFEVPDDPPKKRRRSPNRKPIRYTVDKADFDAVAAELGTDAAPEVGRLTFEYYFENEVPES